MVRFWGVGRRWWNKSRLFTFLDFVVLVVENFSKLLKSRCNESLFAFLECFTVVWECGDEWAGFVWGRTNYFNKC